MKLLAKFIWWVGVGVVASGWYSHYLTGIQVELNRDLYLQQLNGGDEIASAIRHRHWLSNHVLYVGLLTWIFGGFLLMFSDIKKLFRTFGVVFMLGLTLSQIGCWKPFEPVMLETIGTNEEGFLIPYSGDTKKQTSTNNEEFLRSNLVSTKQIKIPQQWVPSGYETWTYNGNWKPGAILIRVDKAPVTREWTADEKSGTSKANEAVWVMTSDQVEFSTGWTVTARINSRDDAVKFLHNYPNGSLVSVLDTEVRAKLQALFGLEVTDLSMDELRKNATPHILSVKDKVEKFFHKRGLSITNLGITGGFVYKNTSIQDKLVEVFNAEQEKNIALAKADAQLQANKQVQLKADGAAKALLTEKKAEAEGIKAVADAKAYELSKAKEDLVTYMGLKRLEVESKKVEKWDGRFPSMFMGGDAKTPDMLLTLPPTEGKK